MGLVWASGAGAAVRRGQADLDLSGTWFRQNAGAGGQDFDGLFLSAGIGYFLTDHIQVQLAGLGIWTTGIPVAPPLNEQEDTFYAFGIRGRYHFMPANPWVPYLGAQFFWGRYERDAPGTVFDAELDGILWGPLAGVRFELNRTNDLFIEYQYHLWSDDVSDVNEPNSPGWDDGHLVMIGLIHRFR